MNLQQIINVYSDYDCERLYVKELAANDNSKNQVYFGGSFEVLNIFPIKDIISDDSGDWNKTRFKSKVDFFWINDEGQLEYAPNAQLILYPKYPEVRFSGFLKGCEQAPSELMASRIERRLLFLGVSKSGKILGYVTSPESSLAKEFNRIRDVENIGIFRTITIVANSIKKDTKDQLLHELKRINALGWINAKRLNATATILPCNASNCGGYTLEAELGITPNGYSEPDYLGWEIKQFGVKSFYRISSQVITLMTPEPTHGYYVDNGVEAFIRKYGYKDKRGREARLNFGGIHKYEEQHKATDLKLILNGYDFELGKIRSSQGYLALVDKTENIAASWSFTSLIKHWNNKHSNACYIPSLRRKTTSIEYKQQYQYGDLVMLGSGTDFSLFLRQIALGNVYYDPGIKLELAIENKREQNIKRRSQFRIKANNLNELYKNYEKIDLKDVC